MTATFADTLPTVTANVRTFERAFESLSTAIERSSITIRQALETVTAATAALGEQLKANTTVAEEPAKQVGSKPDASEGREVDDEPKDKLLEVTVNIKREVKENFDRVFDGIFDSVGDALGDAVLGNKAKLGNLKATIRKNLGNLGKSILKTVIGAFGQKLLQPVKDAGNSLLDAILAGGRTDADPSRAGRGSGGGGPGDRVTEGLGNIVTGIGNGVSTLLGGITKGLGALTRGIGGALSTLGAGLSTALGVVVEGLGSILGSVFSSFGGSGGGFGGILGSLFQIGAGFLGPAAGVGASSAAQSTALSLSGPRFQFAHGGRPPLGKASLVGEAGPELFVPDSLGEIVPNDRLGGPGGGGTVNVTQNFDFRGADLAAVATLRREAVRIKREVLSEILTSASRGGTFARMARV